MAFDLDENRIVVGFESGEVITWSTKKLGFIKKEHFSANTITHAVISDASTWIYDSEGTISKHVDDQKICEKVYRRVISFTFVAFPTTIITE